MGSVELAQPEETLFERLASRDAIADPYPLYAELRSLGPVQVEAPEFPILLLGRYNDCASVIRDSSFMVQTPDWMNRVTPGWSDHSSSWAFEAMVFRNPPEHTRLRNAVTHSFKRPRVEQLREEIGRITHVALDRLADCGADGSTVNLQEFLAQTLPISVIGSLIGVPAADWPMLYAHTLHTMRMAEFSPTEADEIEADKSATVMREYFTDLVAVREKTPREDLTSELIQSYHATRSSGESPVIGREEIIQSLAFLFTGAADSMTNMMVNGAEALLNHPDQAQLLHNKPELAGSAVEEMLRYAAPNHLVARVAPVDMEVCGMACSQDQLILSFVGAGNRDPERYVDPDSFNISRNESAALLSFGGGVHYCLGAPLARLEAAIFFPELLKRFPNLQSAGDSVRDGLVFRRFKSLPVTLH